MKPCENDLNEVKVYDEGGKKKREKKKRHPSLCKVRGCTPRRMSGLLLLVKTSCNIRFFLTGSKV